MIKLKGYAEFTLTDVNNNVTYYRHDNAVLLGGKRLLLSLLGDSNSRPNFLTYIGVGLGNTPVTVQDSTLDIPITGSGGRRAINSFEITEQSDGGVVAAFSAFFEEGHNLGNIYEYGLFNAESGGILFNRSVLDIPIVKNAGDELNLNYHLVLS